jgi:FkbM family methyltransferase
VSASAGATPIPRGRVSSLLRMGRVTRHLPKFVGLNVLLGCYQRIFPAGTLFRIDDFDGDLKLDVNICETIGVNLWHAPGLYERRERELFCSTMKPGCTVLDVGANLGIYTLLASKRGARVFAIEADPLNAKALRKHVALNQFADRVSTYEMAATARDEEVKLYRNPRNSGGSSLYGQGQPVSVEGRSIDSLQLPPIDLCKMDIEGAELRALEGMTETLQRSPHMRMLVECFQDGSNLLRFLRQRFQHITVVGQTDSMQDQLPAYCNLWAWNSQPERIQ